MANRANQEKNCTQASCFMVWGMSWKSFRMMTNALSYRPPFCMNPDMMRRTPTTAMPADRIITWYNSAVASQAESSPPTMNRPAPTRICRTPLAAYSSGVRSALAKPSLSWFSSKDAISSGEYSLDLNTVHRTATKNTAAPR